MAAHPKNKITRVEQGKRRAGNTPKLLKDMKKSATPLHKKGLFARFAKAVAGATSKPASRRSAKNTKTAARAAKTVTPAAPKAVAKPAAAKVAKVAKKPTVKKTTKK